MLGPFKIDLKPRGGCSWREQASNYNAWAKWDRAWRKRLGWRAGLSFWSKTNVKGSRVLLSRHWPHRLCWSWSIWVSRNRPGYETNRIGCVIIRQYRNCDIFLWKWRISYHWQDSDWMAAIDRKHDAPTIYWKHHLEHAEPIGSA